jgi:hypothetical protein
VSQAQIIALTIIVKAILLTSKNKPEIIKTIKEIVDSGFVNADDKMQADIDASLMNWINSTDL